jgi:2-methylaconitate cis-trans-isomerase PrpF
VPENGIAVIRIFQANISKTIIAHVPIENGQVVELGDFELDGVTFAAAEVQLDFMDPADDGEGAMFPTGALIDALDVPGIGTFQATMINAGIPTIFLNARDLGFTGCELQDDINTDEALLARNLKRFELMAPLKWG